MFPLLKTCVLNDERIVAVFPCTRGNELVDAHVITYDDWSRRFGVHFVSADGTIKHTHYPISGTHSFPEALRFARKQLGWG